MKSNFKPPTSSSPDQPLPLPDPIWDGLLALVSAVPEADAGEAIQSILKTGSSLSGASTIIVYLAHNQQPFLRRHTTWGSAEQFPEVLSPQDLVDSLKPHLWIIGQRPSNTLQRVARGGDLAYLAVAPIGPSNAAVGLVALADTAPPATSQTLFLTQLLAARLNSLLEEKSQAATLVAQLTARSGLKNDLEGLESFILEGAVWLDHSLQIKHINKRAETILGYINREVIGKPVENILIGPEGLSASLAAAQQGSVTYDLEDAYLYRRNGEAFLAQIHIIPVREGISIQSILVLFQDLTEQEQIRQLAQRLEQRATLGEVMASFAHEVLNPINSISTGLQLMARSYPADDPHQESISRFLQDCDRVGILLRGVLAFARPMEYEMEKTHVEVVLQRMLDRLQHRLMRMNVQSSLVAEPGIPPIMGNLRALEQVFENFINNAAEAMSPSGGILALRVQPLMQEEGRRYVEISIADTGPGIPKEDQDRIFQPFFTTKTNGTGLGLAISRRIITAHKGHIRLESFPGGTIFFIQIPAAENT